MPTKPPQVALGYFVRFMAAYGAADEYVRGQLAGLEQSWQAGTLSDQAYVLLVSGLLGIQPPAIIT